MEQERVERERKRAENEMQQMKDARFKEKVQQISLTSHGQKVLKKIDEEVRMCSGDSILAVSGRSNLLFIVANLCCGRVVSRRYFLYVVCDVVG